MGKTNEDATNAEALKREVNILKELLEHPYPNSATWVMARTVTIKRLHELLERMQEKIPEVSS